ncbi:hypothetical protein ALP99_200153 [Pseudomonas syringae pv. tomato]|nr:hypothetical protein ALP99_200153 [Pseudomonas syringae pv. tomato]
MTVLFNTRKTSNRKRFGVFQLLTWGSVAVEDLHQVVAEFAFDRAVHHA